MNGRSSDFEVLLEVAFCRWSAMELSVGVDESQILTLGRGERGCCVWSVLRHKNSYVSRHFTGGDDVVNVRYRVELSETERVELNRLVSGGKQAVRRVKRAQILLASDSGQSEEGIARALGVGMSTVYRSIQWFTVYALRSAEDDADPNEIVPRSGGTCPLRPSSLDELDESRAVEGEGVLFADRISLQTL
jgi:hypothetical protein